MVALARLDVSDRYRRGHPGVNTFVSLFELGLRGEVRHDCSMRILPIYVWAASVYRVERKLWEKMWRMNEEKNKLN